MESSVTITFVNVDWDLLREQKGLLLELIGSPVTSKYADAADGIVNLLDFIQDEAAKQLGEEAVFGVSE